MEVKRHEVWRSSWTWIEQEPTSGHAGAARLTAGLVHIIDDDPDAVNTLIEVAGTRRFEHRIQQLRHARESRRAYDAAVQEYTERGYQVIEDSPVWGDTTCVAHDHLRTADGEQATEAALTDPAHWAVTLYEEDGYADAETGEIVAGESDITRRPDRPIQRKTRSEPARQASGAPAGRASDSPAGRSRGGRRP